ncbi:MAG: FAD-binding protein [Pseudomonadota bacterium]
MALDGINPRDEADVAQAILDARGPLNICGSGTRPVGVTDGADLNISGLTGIGLYEPGAMTLVARAGTPVAEIEHVLASEQQQLAFEPMDHRVLLGTTGEPTLGGLYATNTSGPRRIQCGAMRDFALGVRFVDGQGRIVKNGGRVMKNVTGYDLVKMLAGTWGTMGVVTEVSLKVVPKAETMATVSVVVADVDQGVAVLTAALGSPFDVTGAAYWDGVAHVRIEGFTGSVSYRSGQLTDRLAQYGDVSMSDDPTLWADIRDVRCFANQPGDVWKISVKPTDGARVAAALPGRVQLDWGGGLVWALVPAGTDVRAALTGIVGHATCVRGIGHGPIFPSPDAAVGAITSGLKAQYDPKNILNPGRMG